MKEKVILAYSGGLDTTFCVLHLLEKGYDVVSAIVNTGGFSEDQLKEIEKKAISLGVVKHYSIDAQDKIYTEIIQYAIKMNSLYEKFVSCNVHRQIYHSKRTFENSQN